jgi:transposase InsO family protein
LHLKLHKNATTTPAVRKAIQESTDSVQELAERYHVNPTTIRRWKKRDTQQDRPHTPKRLNTKLTFAEEQLIIQLRTQLRLGGDDILEVLQRSVNPHLSRSGIFRCLKRLGLSQLPPLQQPEPTQAFEDYPCGFIHMDLKHVSRLDGKPAYVFVAIDRATRFVYVEIHSNRSGQTSADFFQRFAEAFGHPIYALLTDNGGEFTDRFAVLKPGKPPGKASGEHPLDKLCTALGIEHKLTRPFKPQTNGMVERFNRKLNEALARVPKQATGHKHFNSHEQRNAYILNFVHNYNRTRLRCLNGQAPLLALANQPRLYTFAGMTTGRQVDGHFPGKIPSPVRLINNPSGIESKLARKSKIQARA